MTHRFDRPHLRLLLCLLVVSAAGCADDGGGGIGSAADADGDFLTDLQEGADEQVDTDRDGVPDYFDLDSDGDGILDPVEAGDMDPATSPIDSDDDGIPDFRDLDSDRNGIPDRDEAYVDLAGNRSDELLDIFGDGVPDYRDLDDDKDNILDDIEIGPVPDAPLNSDGDLWPGTDRPRPNFQDPDSDNDGILDGHDRATDFDRDGLRNLEDDDSDNDGIPDREEAGDDDIRTIPIDTDQDGSPDFTDIDSDDDGLSDAIERERGLDPRSRDTDGDGVLDLVEVVACFDPEETGCDDYPTDPTRNPRTAGDFVFVMPFEDTPSPERDTLKFGTDIRVADVYFLMDTTGSMGGAIDSLKASLSQPETGLIDRIRETIPDVWFGVGDHKDYSASPYGGGSDYAFQHRLDMSESAADAQAAVNTLSASGGFDGPESQGPSLFAIATGEGLPGRSLAGGGTLPPRTDCPRGRVGYPCFRENAVPIAVLMTDAPWHNGPGNANPYDNGTVGGPAPTYDGVINALVGANVRFIGITVGRRQQRPFDEGDPASCSITETFWEEADQHLRNFGTAVGSVDAEDNPFVTRWFAPPFPRPDCPTPPESPISDVVVDQIELLARGSRFDISIEFTDGPEDSVDTEDVFLDRVEAVEGGDVVDCPFRVPIDTDADRVPDTFFNVAGGTPVCFDVFVKENRTIDETPEPQLFRATLTVRGDGFTTLDVRDIYFLVPPDPELGVVR
jgi:hypothetical protein